MPASLQTDVLLVGAGPTGLSLASQLIRLGVDFILIDQGEGITPYSKAVGVQARTLEIYDQIGLADALIGAGTIAQNVKLIEGGEVRGTVELATIGKGLSPYPFLLLIEQNKHEDLLYDFLKAHGQEVRWKTDLQMFSQTDEGVTATVTTAGGEPRTIEANYLVGCDGARSAVRRGLGLTFEGSTMERLFYVADVHIDWKLGHQSVMICLSKDVLTAFFPLPGENRYRIVGTFPEGDQRQEGTVLYEEIEGQIKASTQLELDIKQVNWFSTYKVHSRRVDSFSKGRCFVAGDAAHIVPPTGAKGLTLAASDVHYLFEGLRGHYLDHSDAALAAYSDRALKRVWKSVRFSWSMTMLMHRFRDSGEFGQKIQEAELDYVTHSTAAAASLAENYVGLPY